MTDITPACGGKYRRTDQPGWLQRLRAGWRDEIGAPA